MSTAIATINAAVPAHLQKHAEAAKALAEAATAGIKVSNFAQLTIGGAKFHIKDKNGTMLITDPNYPPAQQVARPVVPFIIVAGRPNLDKTFYPGGYVAGSTDEPTCSSENGVTPDGGTARQSPNCATCPQAQWGSRKTPEGKDAKACSDSKRVVLISSEYLDYQALAFDVTASALKDFGLYVKALTDSGRPLFGVVTQLGFDAKVSYPKVTFTYLRDLTADEMAKIEERMAGADVQDIVKPRSVALPALAAPTMATEPVVPAAQNHIPATMAAPLGAPPQAVAAPAAPMAPPAAPFVPAVQPPAAPVAPAQTPWDIKFAALAPALQAAVTLAGGPSSEAGQTLLLSLVPDSGKKTRAKKDTPVEPAAAPQAMPSTPAEPAMGFPGAAAPPAAPVAAAPTGFPTAPVAAPAPAAAPAGFPTAAAAPTHFSEAPAANVVPAAAPGATIDLGSILQAALAAKPAG